jgi:hypothetical protein
LYRAPAEAAEAAAEELREHVAAAAAAAAPALRRVLLHALPPVGGTSYEFEAAQVGFEAAQVDFEAARFKPRIGWFKGKGLKPVAFRAMGPTEFDLQRPTSPCRS